MPLLLLQFTNGVGEPGGANGYLRCGGELQLEIVFVFLRVNRATFAEPLRLRVAALLLDVVSVNSLILKDVRFVSRSEARHPDVVRPGLESCATGRSCPDWAARRP